jgi:hypothetical protein
VGVRVAVEPPVDTRRVDVVEGVHPAFAPPNVESSTLGVADAVREGELELRRRGKVLPCRPPRREVVLSVRLIRLHSGRCRHTTTADSEPSVRFTGRSLQILVSGATTAGMDRLYVYNGTTAVIGLCLLVSGVQSVVTGGHTIPALFVIVSSGAMVSGAVYSSVRTDPEAFSFPAARLVLLVTLACLAVVTTALSLL